MRALLKGAVGVAAAIVAATPAFAHPWPYAAFSSPTDRYAHGVLGDAIEYGALEFGFTAWEDTPASVIAKIELPEDRVFEDVQPRTIPLPTGGWRDIVVVESQRDLGAQLAVYRVEGDYLEHERVTLKKIAATPHIGQRNRWLAPAGIADFDGDGQNDIAYVETPHLGKILKIVTLRGDQLIPVAAPQAGFSNHRIGQDFITSGVRHCEGRIDLLTPNAGWTALMAVRVENGEIVAEATPFEASRAGITAAQQACQP